jgi:hypothetical protein
MLYITKASYSTIIPHYWYYQNRIMFSLGVSDIGKGINISFQAYITESQQS